MLAHESLRTRTPELLSDHTFGLDLLPRYAAEITSIVAVLVMMGTSCVIG